MNSRLFRLTLASLLLAPFAATAQTVDAGEDVVLECESAAGAEYTLNGTAPTGEGIVNEWTTDPTVELTDADTLTPTGTFPLGVTTVTLTSTQEGSDPLSDDATVTVEDSQAPVVRLKADPFYLWPPNHELHQVQVQVHVRDRCASEDSVEVELIEARSDEPDNGRGDGNTSNDIQGADLGSDDRAVMLRAERSGNGNGRVYTLVYRVTDGSGNDTEAEAKVYVPHDYSDLKDRIGGDDRPGPSDMGPICPRPNEAIAELAEIFPGLGSVRNEQSCTNICRAWAKSCDQIAVGSGRCTQGEERARALIAAAECKDSDDRDAIRECRNDARQEYNEQKVQLRDEVGEARDTCDRYGRRCANACSDMFDDSSSALDGA